jgi:hypothetical protein
MSQLAPGARAVPVVALLTHVVPVAKVKSVDADEPAVTGEAKTPKVIFPDVTPPTLVTVYLIDADVVPLRIAPKSRTTLVAGLKCKFAALEPVPVTTTVAICPLLPLITRTTVERVARSPAFVS